MNPDDLRAIAEKAAKMTDGLVVAPRGPLSAFYAAFNPSTCLALLDGLDGLKARVESAESALRPFQKQFEYTSEVLGRVDDADYPSVAANILQMAAFRAASAHFTKHPEGKI